MANPEHLDILKQGVEVWNQWREKNPDVVPDLIQAKLSGTDLSYADLSYTDLTKADLTKSKFVKTSFCFANLRDAQLSGGKLIQVNFTEANLCGSNLSRVILNGVLHGTNLTGADLSYADIRGAEISWTIFANIDLSTVIGLDLLVHYSPSTIGLDTIYKSKGNIPEVFLRGCGLPDEFISYIPSLTGKGIEYYSCFISYSHRDDDFATRLHNDLQAKGVRCWFAPHDMKIGDKIRPTINDSIRLHDKLLLILSEHSVQSDWVEHEVEHALDLERERKKVSLFPVRIDDAIMESKTGWAGNVKRQHIGDFTQWKQHDAYQSAFDRLLQDLKAG